MVEALYNFFYNNAIFEKDEGTEAAGSPTAESGLSTAEGRLPTGDSGPADAEGVYTTLLHA